jgi:hypothetical protein
MNHTSMDENRFWSLIDPVAQIPGEDIEEQEECMEHQLSLLSDDELVSFQMRYDQFHSDAYRWDLWEVAFFTGGGCSDDGFTYFRNWLIGRGRKAFVAVIERPDNLADYPMGDDPVMSAQCVEWDLLPSQVWESRDQSRTDDQWFNLMQHGNSEPKDPIGTKFDENDVEGYRTRYPRLSSMYQDMLES